jgi:hypothetical protein
MAAENMAAVNLAAVNLAAVNLAAVNTRSVAKGSAARRGVNTGDVAAGTRRAKGARRRRDEDIFSIRPVRSVQSAERMQLRAANPSRSAGPGLETASRHPRRTP